MASILMVLCALLTIASGSINYYNIDTYQGRADVSRAFQSPLPWWTSRYVQAVGLKSDENIRFSNWLNKLRMQMAINTELHVVPEPQPAANETKYSPWDNYTDIKSCEGRPHTFWVYRKKNPAPACDKVIKAGLTAMEKRKILDFHNDMRQKVARGKETRGKPGPQPPAQYMKIMEWDDELAELAQRWANQCNFVTDQCRDVERFKVYQHLTQETVDGDVMKTHVEDMVKNWYNKVDKVDATRISNYTYGSQDQSYYTQMVWADTNKIGCGAMRYLVPSGKRFYLVCNYGPAGNIKGQPVYKIF